MTFSFIKINYKKEENKKMIVVVARYNENVEWTNQFPNVIVYNKGYPLDYNVQKEVMWTNVGREGHTYYQYIYDNYDNLEDYTIFLQGNPFDHSPNIISDIHRFITPPIDISLNFEFLTRQIYDCNLTKCKHHVYEELPLRNIYEKLFNDGKSFTEELEYNFGVGAQFVVSKEQILKRPREFYLNIVKLLDHDINPKEGFVIERFHELIFSYTDQKEK